MVDFKKMKTQTPFTTPGRYASERYARALNDWRKTIKRRFWYVAGPVAAVFVGLATVFARHPEFWIGATLGAAVGIVVMIYDSPPEYVSRWGEGAEGEKSTGAALKSLANNGYVIRHDLPKFRGNFDHVVVGPTGVFLVDSKVPWGLAEVHGDDLHIRRSANDQDTYVCEGLGVTLRGAAAELSEDIYRATGTKTYVRAIVAIWSRVREPIVEGDRVAFLHGSRVGEWIKGHPSSLRADQFRAVIAYFNSLTAPESPGTSHSPQRVPTYKARTLRSASSVESRSLSLRRPNRSRRRLLSSV